MVTTRSGMRKTSTVRETKKPKPPEPILDKGETLKSVTNHETTNNSCEKNPKDTSIKEIQSTDPFCKCIVKTLLNRTAPEHELKTFFIHNGLLYRYASDHSKDFCTLVIPKAWRYTILVETHEKNGTPRKQSNVFPDQVTVLLERNGKGCERLHPMMSSMLTGESTSTIISTTHDRNPRLTFQQNRNGSIY